MKIQDENGNFIKYRAPARHKLYFPKKSESNKGRALSKAKGKVKAHGIDKYEIESEK